MSRKPTAENQPRISQNSPRPQAPGSVVGGPSNLFDRDRGTVDLNVGPEPQVGDVQIRFNNVQGEGRIPGSGWASGDKRPANSSSDARGPKPQG